MKARNGGYIKTVTLWVFMADVIIVVTEDPNEFLDKSKLRLWATDEPDEDVNKYCDAFTFQKQKSGYYIVVSPNVTPGVLAHECSHAIGRMFRDRGQKADYYNDEVFCYYVGWLVDISVSWLDKVKNELLK